MIRYRSEKQLSLAGFEGVFETTLDKDNRWIRLSRIIPWDDLAQAYYQNLSTNHGRPAKDARLVIGAVIIKHKLCLSDEETVQQIRENPYLQYFVGLPGFQYQAPFAPSLFVEIRRRMGEAVFEHFHQAIVDKIEALSKKTKTSSGSHKDAQHHDDDDPPQGSNQNRTQPQECAEDSVSENASATQSKTHQGKLIVDATVAEQCIRYPTDLGLLNEARQISERLIDVLYRQSTGHKKPRSYRQKARRAYLAMAKQRRPRAKKRRQAIKAQLQYLRRNLGHIKHLLDAMGEAHSALSARQWRQYWIIQHLYAQQQQMYRDNKRRCDHRLVSISQPHVRPIIRGKVRRSVEFGAKLSVSLTGHGLAHVDHLRWEAFHEGLDLKSQVQAYHHRYGVYPQTVLGDPLYGTRDNRRYLKAKGIEFAGKPLGRPKKPTDSNRQALKQQARQRREQYRQRIPIEGKFGQGKNGYRLNAIRAKTKATSEAWIRSIFLVMNLLVLARVLFWLCKMGALWAWHGCRWLICAIGQATQQCHAKGPRYISPAELHAV